MDYQNLITSNSATLVTASNLEYNVQSYSICHFTLWFMKYAYITNNILNTINFMHYLSGNTNQQNIDIMSLCKRKPLHILFEAMTNSH